MAVFLHGLTVVISVYVGVFASACMDMSLPVQMGCTCMVCWPPPLLIQICYVSFPSDLWLSYIKFILVTVSRGGVDCLLCQLKSQACYKKLIAIASYLDK